MGKLNHFEKLMEAVRNAPAGSKAKAKAWVAYMRLAKQPSEPRREFADMMRRHLKWPMGMAVMVSTPQGYIAGTVTGHRRESPHKCFVDFSPVLVNYDGHGLRHCALVPFRSMKPVGREL